MVEIPVGKLLVSWYIDPVRRQDDRFKVERADPVIEVTAEFLAQIRLHGEMARMIEREPWVTLEAGVLSFWPTDDPNPVVYREVAYNDRRDTYVFAWPD
jgi:hypothetical protein